MKEYRIDLSGVVRRKELHRIIRETLPVPEWYGGNLDALYDVLTDPSFCEGESVRITFCGSGDFVNANPGYYHALQVMCRAAEEETGRQEFFFD